ncbi:hypothetical protein D9M68_839400 [compost metagenome]
MAINPTTDHGLSAATKAGTAAGPRRSSSWRVSMPATRGSTTYSSVDSSSVSHGTVTLVTPSSKAAMGAKATTMMRSLIDTCTSV